MTDLESARAAGRQWAAEHPLNESQQQRLRALLAEDLTAAS